jgi:hypothetical protein
VVTANVYGKVEWPFDTVVSEAADIADNKMRCPGASLRAGPTPGRLNRRGNDIDAHYVPTEPSEVKRVGSCTAADVERSAAGAVLY